jgi:hypothetical protein
MHLHSDKGEIEPGRRPPGPSRDPSSKGPAALVVQGKADPDAVVDLQRTVGNAAVVQLLRSDDGPDDGSGDLEGAGGQASPVLDVVGKGGGQPLDAGVRTGMERALGADLSGVRIHTDGAAAASAQAVQAHAYTVGHEVVFGPGQYEPGSPSGQRTLAHELTHVVQQRSGPVAGTPTGDGISLSDPADPFERAAEANAERILSGSPADAHNSSPAGSAGVQREAATPEEEEEPVQGMWAQREAADEEDQEPAPA